jgi:hypothetical protein
VNLYFRGQKTAKVVGQLAINVPEDGSIASGVLVRRNFNYHLLHPNDLSSKLPNNFPFKFEQILFPFIFIEQWQI